MSFRNMVIGAAFMGLSMAPATSLMADQHVSFGQWGYYYYDDVNMCVASTNWSDGRFFGVKFQNGKLFIHFMRPGWHIPDGTKIPMRMKVDSANGWRFDAHAIQTTEIKNQSLVEFTFLLSEKNPDTGEFYWEEFLNLMKGGLVVNIYFDAGTEPSWRAELGGSSNAINYMVLCIDKILKADRGGTTQPYSKTPQPYGKTG